MSDVNGGSGPAPGPGGTPVPPPPPPGMFDTPAAPPQAPAPVPQPYGAPAPQPARPRARRTGLIIGIVVAVLALCGLVTCATMAVVGMGAAEKAETIALAETHWVAAASAVESAGVSLDEMQGASDADAVVGEATSALRTSRDEIAAARAAIERLEESEGRSDYLAALAALTAAVDGLEDLVAYVGLANRMAEDVSRAAGAADAAADDLNAAIGAGNKRDYARMRTRAREASSGFAKAASMFRAAHELDESAGLDKAAAYCDVRRKQADLVVKMADSGKAGRISAYNKDVDRMNEMNKKAEAMGEPEVVTDPDWVTNRLADLTVGIEKAGEDADRLRAQALQKLGYGD